jgi:lysophospholipase L1-like esterase
MKKVHRFASVLILLLLVASATYAQSGFYLKDGDRVVFYGDSITDQRLYTTFVETYVVTRFPRMNVSFVHSGWGGDRVTGGGGGKIDERLRRDVIAYKPTVVTIMLGMNDASYKPYDAATFDTYTNGYQHITQTLKSALPGARLTLIQPSPYDDVTRAPTFDGGYNAVLVRYGGFIKELAQKEGHHVADLNTSVVGALRKANDTDASLAQRIVPDRVHPGPGGHLLMAEALLRAWNAPAIVSSIEIDAAARKLVRADNSKVTGLSQDGLRWTQEDGALPLPLDMKEAALALAVRSSDVVSNLNRQMLRVAGLSAPRYTLKIDNEEVGSFTKEQLGEGINLATLPTPMMKQAAAVHALTLKHNTVHFAGWRQVHVPLQDNLIPEAKNAVKALDDLETELVRQQRAAAQPKARRYELIPQM